MAKHFDLNITDDRFTFARNTAKIDAEAALDGVYVVRTTVAEAVLDQTSTVTAYKQLSTAERAFRSLKTVDLEVRPIYHRRADRVRVLMHAGLLRRMAHAPKAQTDSVRRSRQGRG
jgi:transposase